MPFESLSHRRVISLTNFPVEWLPLTYLYDSDLPLFPLFYFHRLSGQISPGNRPGYTDRVFGYIEKINTNMTTIDVTVVLNKDLTSIQNNHYIPIVEDVIRERLGLSNPVTVADIRTAFTPPINNINNILFEIWNRVIQYGYGNRLPFGRLWDEVLGLARFVASYYSPSGRKGEFIQTHYFTAKFGERIQSGGGIPQIDFYLLPTWEELIDRTNPLALFPNYAKLVDAANLFHQNHCRLINIHGLQVSGFNNALGGTHTADRLKSFFDVPAFNNCRTAAVECFNAFDKGPVRPMIFLMMLSDIRNGRFNPQAVTPLQFGALYDLLDGSYHSPKVIHIYAQQCFGNTVAMPIDTWIETFLTYPFNIPRRVPAGITLNEFIFTHGNNNLGKVERLLWFTSQARKVHSSACDDALWCLKYASNKLTRGANPLSCKICRPAIRNQCPAFAAIQNEMVTFNGATAGTRYSITTESGNNTTQGQIIQSCQGIGLGTSLRSRKNRINDDFSIVDNPTSFHTFPHPRHNPVVDLTVQDFINMY